MSINDFCNSLKNKYPNTKEVLEQIEEIRDTLNMKLEEYQEKGYKYSDATKESISSLGNIESLFEELTTDVKTIYKGKAKVLANIMSATIVFSVATIISILSQFMPFLYAFKPTVPYGYGQLVFAFSIVFFMIFQYIVNINKVSVIKITIKDKRQSIKTALIVSIIFSIAMIIMNLYSFNSNEIIWFPWPIIGISNWPICILIYYKLINSKKFDAKNIEK